MTEIPSIVTQLPGIESLWHQTLGDSRIRVAVLDGLVDQAHPCFLGARLSRIPTLVQGEAQAGGSLSNHGTGVASILFGQPGSLVSGIAPHCTGLIVPVFSDDRRKLSQLDLSRAIEQAVQAGAHIINISGGQLTEAGEAEPWLQRSAQLCQEHHVLLVAAAGNDGCDCLHVPAALPAVLAVGALDQAGNPLDLSNWGEIYQGQGILAPGEQILGAKAGGGTAKLNGTSFAAPIVSGVAALLLSLQVQAGHSPNPYAARAALLGSASPCPPNLDSPDPRCLVGKLHIAGAAALTNRLIQVNSLVYAQSALPLTPLSSGGTMSEPASPRSSSTPEMESTPPALQTSGSVGSIAAVDPEPKAIEAIPEALPTIVPGGCGCGGGSVAVAQPTPVVRKPNPESSSSRSPDSNPVPGGTGSLATSSPMHSDSVSYSNPALMSQPTSPSVNPSQAPTTNSDGLVYVIGTLGYDFGTEARRDSFKQLMPAVTIDNIRVPANPYDARQMSDYLGENIAEARSLIWTLNLELTPIYAIEPAGPFAREVYQILQEFLEGEVQAETDEEYIERVSIPARITGRSVRLFSGQMVPVIEPQNTRGLYGWKIRSLVQAAIEAARQENPEAADEALVTKSLESFLNRVYYDLRNLGATSQDRALNFAATNAFQAAQTFIKAVVEGMQLDSISVVKSPFCRLGSDCWDVQLKFFDPENRRRARRVFRFTIDVSDVVPVTLGEVRSWTTPS